MDWFLYDIGLRHERVNRRFDCKLQFSRQLFKNNLMACCDDLRPEIQRNVFPNALENKAQNHIPVVVRVFCQKGDGSWYVLGKYSHAQKKVGAGGFK